MNVKDKKVFSLRNFRGLDKENKLLKVEKSSASDGYNFLIDSETLKTRPALKYKEEPAFFLTEDDYIIDWYNLGGVKLYITKKHIFIQDGSFIMNELSTDDKLIRNSFPTFNFEGMTPLFREEKNCLFMFCMENIYVFSYIRNVSTNNVERYVLYELRNKPSNPYLETSDYYEFFDNLPSPYEPTLFIGLNPVDDVNLLSDTFKYQIFASSNQNEEDTKVIFKLPTHFDPKKHGTFDYVKNNMEIKFYKDRFSDIGVVPVFLGRNGENFTLDSSYGGVLNQSTPVEIEDTFFPSKDFEYFKSNDETPVITPITELLGLNRERFFKFNVKSNNQNVFEYLINYIKVNGDSFLENKVFVFSLPVQYNAVYKDIDKNFIENKIVQKDDVLIFIQLKKYENSEYTLQSTSTHLSQQVNEFNLANPYPNYPTISGSFEHVVNLSGTPIMKALYNQYDFESMARTYLHGNMGTYANGDVVRVNARFYTPLKKSYQRHVTIEGYQDWLMSSKTGIVWNNHASFPAYPTIPNTFGYEVVESNTIISTSGQNINYQDPDLITSIQNTLLDLVDGMVESQGNGWGKIRIQTYYSDGQGTFYEVGVSVVIPFTYAKGYVENYEKRQSMSYVALIDKDQTYVEPDLFEFSFKEEEHAFELKVKNYFYDYNDEPSIDVKLKFQLNPNYNYIAKSKFGTTFGSENRLFLTGNPEFPNMDRYNVSNDLLGNNVINQSYELTYFPSKNYRVLGGKGAINGYVVATDTQLYITKEEYPNDERFFIRERYVDDNGIVTYKEYKTSISKTPLNNRCIVRFYNDVLILAKDGLWGIEISSNVLTNERLVKLRSGFINKDLVSAIKNYDTSKIFILENNTYMYIFIGTEVYVADSRYTSKNENNVIENLSYEIVKWVIHNTYRMGKMTDNETTLLEESGDVFYHLVQDNVDDKMFRKQSAISNVDIPSLVLNEGTQSYDTEYLHNAFIMPQAYDYILNDPLKYSILLYHGYKLVGKSGVDYHIENDNTIVIDKSLSFRDIENGQTLYFKSGSTFYPFEVENFDEYTRLEFTFDDENLGEHTAIYKDISKVPLYVSCIFEQNVTGDSQKEKVFRLSPYRQDVTPPYLTQTLGENDFHFSERIKEYMLDNEDYFFTENEMFDCLINEEKTIEMKWISGITDMGNNLMEKTMFRVNLYATKQDKANNINFGYKTMRRIRRLEDGTKINVSKKIDLSNTFNFGEVDFNTFSLNTFNEFGISLPAKENNFLYIQFILIGEGQIELNSIEVIYKLNRMLKTIG